MKTVMQKSVPNKPQHFRIKLTTFKQLTKHFPVFSIPKIAHQILAKPRQKHFPTKNFKVNGT